MHQNLAVKACIMLNRGLLYVHLNGLGHGVQVSAYLRFSSIRIGHILLGVMCPACKHHPGLTAPCLWWTVQYVQDKMTLT